MYNKYLLASNTLNFGRAFIMIIVGMAFMMSTSVFSHLIIIDQHHESEVLLIDDKGITNQQLDDSAGCENATCKQFCEFVEDAKIMKVTSRTFTLGCNNQDKILHVKYINSIQQTAIDINSIMDPLIAIISLMHRIGPTVRVI